KARLLIGFVCWLSSARRLITSPRPPELNRLINPERCELRSAPVSLLIVNRIASTKSGPLRACEYLLVNSGRCTNAFARSNCNWARFAPPVILARSVDNFKYDGNFLSSPGCCGSVLGFGNG